MNGTVAVPAHPDIRNPEKLAADDLDFLSGVVYAADGVTHEPFGSPNGPGLWHHKGMQLPAYIQQVAHDIKDGGMTESRAIATAVSRCKVWCATSKDAAVKAKACAAVAEWEKLKGESHSAAWNPALHPRVPKGQPGGGRFAPGATGGTPTNAQPVGQGENSGRVTDLQNRLNQLGFHVKVDGKFGPQMEAAVRKFQQEHGLKVDGLVGPKTTAALRMKHPHKKHPGHTHVHKNNSRAPKTHVKKAAGVTLPDLVTMPGVELLAAGTWELSSGRNTFTREDIQSAIDAVNCPAVGPAAIKLGHVDPRFDGEPALGRVLNLRTNDAGDKLIGDLVDMPGWLGGIAHAAFPKRSIEGSYGMTCQIGHKHPFVLTGLALLGITSPGVGVLNGLPDIASLYGIQAAAVEREVVTAPLDLEGDVVAITEEDVRRAYYEYSGAPSDWWITELQMSPTQLVVSAGDGSIFRVPFSIEAEDGEITFEAAEPVQSYQDLAASRGTGRVITYASADVSRSVIEAADSNNGWVQRDGKWVYDPDGDGDDDSKASTDTDHSHWDANGKMKPGCGPIPPKPTMDPKAAADNKPYGDVKYADPKNGKYPIDTEEHARAAWSYINKAKNASVYPLNGVSLQSVKDAIVAACKKFGINVSDDTAKATAEGFEYNPDTGDVFASDPSAGEPEQSGKGSKKDDGAQVQPNGSHAEMSGTHSHPHPAYGSQGGDQMHTHQHTHSGDAVHKHAHAKAGAGNKEGDSEVEFTTEQETSLRAALGLGEDDDFSADKIVTAAADLKAQKVRAGSKVPQGVVQIAEEVWNNTLKKVEASERFRAKVLRDERDEVIDKAIRDGKFSAASRPVWVRQWDADPEATRDTLATLKRNVVPVEDIGSGGGSLDDEAFEEEFKGLYPPGTFDRNGR